MKRELLSVVGTIAMAVVLGYVLVMIGIGLEQHTKRSEERARMALRELFPPTFYVWCARESGEQSGEERFYPGDVLRIEGCGTLRAWQTGDGVCFRAEDHECEAEIEIEDSDAARLALWLRAQSDEVD